MLKPSGCGTCPLNETGKGFCLSQGDPATAQLAICLETPAQEEIGYLVIPPPLLPKFGYDLTSRQRKVLPTKESGQREMEIRGRLYPNMDASFYQRGVPIVGRTGAAIESWLFAKVGIQRDQIFLTNTLHCLPPKAKSGATYPIGKTKLQAELECRQYDQGLRVFRPQVIVLTLHPASLFKDIVPLPLVIKDLEKAVSFVRAGHRTLVLMGGHAAEVFLGYGSNVTRWRGHYEVVPDAEKWYDEVVKRAGIKAVGGAKMGKAKKVKVVEDEPDPFDAAIGIKKRRRARKKKEVANVTT